MLVRAFVVAAACLLTSAATADEDVPAKIEVIPGRGATSGEVLIEGDAAIVALFSQGGIGDAKLRLVKGNWPAKVVVRLRYSPDRGFSMLEGLTLRTSSWQARTFQKQADAVEILAISEKPDEPPRKLGEVENPIRSDAKGIEIHLPAKWLSMYDEIELHWVDAYRG